MDHIFAAMRDQIFVAVAYDLFVLFIELPGSSSSVEIFLALLLL